VNLLRAELLKAVTTRLLLWYALGLLAFLGFVLSTRIASDRPESLVQQSTQRSVLETAGLGAVFAVLLGAVLVTNEYAHGTINQTFLAAPRRHLLIGAKLAAALLVALAFAVFACVLTVLIAKLWYGGRGLSLDLSAEGVTTPLLGTLGACLAAAAIGVGIGALLRRQGATIALILIWLLIGEAAVGAVGDSARYAPGHALAAVVVAHSDGSGSMLGVWGGAVLAAWYGVFFAAAGGALLIASDVPSSGE
jgi:ABC-2 type transport system permease protein